MGSDSWRVATDEATWSEKLHRIYEFEVGVPLTRELTRSRARPRISSVAGYSGTCAATAGTRMTRLRAMRGTAIMGHRAHTQTESRHSASLVSRRVTASIRFPRRDPPVDPHNVVALPVEAKVDIDWRFPARVVGVQGADLRE